MADNTPAIIFFLCDRLLPGVAVDYRLNSTGANEHVSLSTRYLGSDMNYPGRGLSSAANFTASQVLPGGGQQVYVFDGWYASANYSFTSSADFTEPISSDLTISGSDIVNGTPDDASLTQRFCFVKYVLGFTVTFEDWDGTVLSTQAVVTGGAATPPADPTRAHYSFTGWAGTYTGVQGNEVVTATYRGEGVGVMFDANGGDLAEFFMVAEYGQAYGTLPVPTRMGHTFDGWFTAASGGTQITSADVASMDATYYAHWTAEAQTTTVVFDATGGTVETGSKSVTTGSEYGVLPEPTRTGYSFAGWYTASMGGTNVTASTVASLPYDHTLYAHWTGAGLAVTFDANGGTVSPGSKLVRIGDCYGTLPVPTRSGYEFNGWYTAASGGTKVTANGRPSAAITLYARWTEKVTVEVINFTT